MILLGACRQRRFLGKDIVGMLVVVGDVVGDGAFCRMAGVGFCGLGGGGGGRCDGGGGWGGKMKGKERMIESGKIFCG